MASQLQLRGGTTAEHGSFTGEIRELTVDTTLKALRLHDGVTAGGTVIVGLSDIQALITALSDSTSTSLSTEVSNRTSAIANLTSLISTAAADRASENTQLAADFAAADVTSLASANTYTDTKISELLGGSPDLLNTLNELAEAIGDDSDFITTINTSITAVQTDVDANETAVNTAIATVQADVDANETAANTAIAAGDATTLTSANTYTDTAITNLTNGADAALDTLKEIGDALAAGDQSVTDAVTTSITTESTARAAADTALSGRLDVLETDPTTQTLLDAESAARTAAIAVETTARGGAITAEETARTAADAATLTSANSYTDTAVASGDTAVTNSLTALVTTESSTRASADSALSSRVDVLEADPPTATARTAAVAGVQADVNQNEADSDSAISAEETRALAAEAVLTTAIATEEIRATTAYASITTSLVAEEAARNQLNLHAGLAFGQLYVGDLVVA